MAHEDVVSYLTGMLIEVSSGMLRAVATDGHRLAMCSMQAGIEQPDRHQVIVPRKGILELARLLNDQDAEVSIVLGQHHIRATTGEFTFTRSEEHTSELQSLMRISYARFCLK